jgi:hypothetical protein
MKKTLNELTQNIDKKLKKKFHILKKIFKDIKKEILWMTFKQ